MHYVNLKADQLTHSSTTQRVDSAGRYKHNPLLVRLTGILLALTASSGLAAAPINDDISNAVIVPTVLPYSDAADTSEATAAVSDPEDCYNNGSVWYSFTPATDFSIDVDTIGSNYDTTLGAYEGSPGSLSVIVCNDDASSGVQSAVRLNVTAGSTYYFMVGFCCGNGEVPVQTLTDYLTKRAGHNANVVRQ
jgi:hypothetical protein